MVTLNYVVCWGFNLGYCDRLFPNVSSVYICFVCRCEITILYNMIACLSSMGHSSRFHGEGHRCEITILYNMIACLSSMGHSSRFHGEGHR